MTPGLRTVSGRRADLLALGALVAGLLVSARDLLGAPVRAGQDATIFFWPTFAFLGERLRAGDIPGWNPHQFAGVPFAADPESGWMYLPAMLVFTLLPLGAAIRLYMALHLLLAGIGAFALGRASGMTRPGALAAGWALALSGLLSDRARCCYAHVQVATWIPWALLGVELALRARSHRARLGGWLLAGIAISQMLGGWLGQGAYYGLLVVASFVAYRVLFPRSRADSAGRRLGVLALHGLVPLAIGLGLAAPGILPRLAYERRSNLAEGYSGPAAWAAGLGGWSPGSQVEALLSPSGWYIGASVFALAVVALATSGVRFAAPYFATLTLVTFILGLEATTPLHRLFALLPRFQETHDHLPERIALALAIGPAMLAGAAVSSLGSTAPRRRRVAMLVGVGGLGIAALTGLNLPLHSWLAVGGIAMVVAGRAGTPSPPNPQPPPNLIPSGVRHGGGDSPAGERGSSTVSSPSPAHGRGSARQRRGEGSPRALIPLALALIVAVDLAVGAERSLRRGDFARVDLGTITQPNATAQQLDDDGSGVAPRFFGFDPSLAFELHGQRTLYRHSYQNPLTARLLVNNQATLWNLADAQGYNPLQLGRYAAFLAALNGTPQEYHGAYILPSGLDSPLLPLLAAEYIVVPRQSDPGQPAVAQLTRRLPEVWGDDVVSILRTEAALPRAWIVHDAVTVPTSDTLSLMASGGVNFERTVVLNRAAPELAVPPAGAADRAGITRYSADALTVETSTGGAGLLVLSEVYDDGWRATVDGRPVDVSVANHAFRAVPVPPGAHTVRLTYTPPGLVPGLLILAVTGALITAALIAAGWRDRIRTE